MHTLFLVLLIETIIRNKFDPETANCRETSGAKKNHPIKEPDNRRNFQPHDPRGQGPLRRIIDDP